MNTVEENSKKTVLAFFENYSNHDLEKAFEAISDDLSVQVLADRLDKQRWLDFEKSALSACPDIKFTINEQLAEGNRVFTHWVLNGTHTNSFFGKPGSGNPVRLEAFSVDTVRDGKIVEHQTMADFNGFFDQFGK